MDPWAYINDARLRYIDAFRRSIREQRDQGSACTTEAWLQGTRKPGSHLPPPLLCADILCVDGEKRRAVLVSSEEPPQGALIGSLRVGQSDVKVFPLTWEILVVWFHHPDFDRSVLDAWRKKWIDPYRGSSADDPDGLCGSVHDCDGPVKEGGGFRCIVDFGSAPVEALTELLTALDAAGAADIEIGQSDGSHLDHSITAVLMQPDLNNETVTDSLAQLLRQLPEVETADRTSSEEIDVRVREKRDTHKIFTGNLYARLKRSGIEARISEVCHFLRSQREVFQDRSAPDLSQLRILIKDDRFLAFLSKDGKSHNLLARRLTADLWSCCVWEESNGMRFARDDEPPQYGLSADAFHARAVENCAGLFHDVEIVNHGPLLVVRRTDAYVATLLLNDQFWLDNAHRVQGKLLACAPARDVLLIAGSDTPGTIAALRDAATRVTAGGDHLITETILVRNNSNTGWEPLPPPDTAPSSPPLRRRWWQF